MISTAKSVVNRVALLEDIRTFNGLVNNSGGAVFFRATFGQFNFSSMVETSVCSLISMNDTADTCLAYLSITDCPGIGKEGDAFDKTIKVIQEHVPEVTNVNSLFVNFLLLAERSDYDMERIGSDLLANAFALNPELDYILWLCPSAVKLTDWTAANFYEPDNEVLREACESKSHVDEPLLGYRLLYAPRDNFFPKLQVRDARIEDNDDLLPILKESAPGLFEHQGSYFLADLIQQQDDGARFFVGVSKNQPVGMLATSVDVNVGLITKVFDVDQYGDMFVAKVKSPPAPPLVLGMLGDFRAVSDPFLDDLIKSNRCALIDAETIKLPATESKDEEELSERQILLAAQQMYDAVKARIASVGAKNAGAPPPFCVVRGYPRNDVDAQVLCQNDPLFDMVVEIVNDGADAAADAEQQDEYLAAHLEGVEAFQAFLTSEKAPLWKKISYSGQNNKDSCEDDFGDTFRELVLTRANESDAKAAAEEDEPPTANAFAITVFCMKDGFESRAEDLLQVVFEDHPGLDYCMFMVPNNAETPNKLVSTMVATKLRTGMSFDQTLYIMHREAFIVRDILCVDRVGESSAAAVSSFLAPLDDKEAQDAATESLKYLDVELKDNPMAVSFQVKVDNNLIGLVVLNRKYIGNDDINWMRSNFEVDEFINFDRHRARAQAYVSHFVMSPVFSKWSRFVVREVMRKYLKTVLYYQTHADVCPPRQILDEFIPVSPRRRMEAQPGKVLPLKERPSAGFSAACPMFHLTKRDLPVPKVTVLKRVVVFGGSGASFAFLERLLFASNYNYPNVYLVADILPVPFCKKGESKADYTTAVHGVLSAEDADDPTMEELYCLGLGHKVHCIQGRLTDIDRTNKAVVVSDELVVEYDLLVIATNAKDKSFKRFPSTSGMHSSYCEKRGIFGIGDAYTDRLALNWIQNQDRSKWATVVYGSGIDVIGAVGTLMKLGVPSRRINVIMPADDLPENCHPSMNDAIVRSLRSSGVQLHRGFNIIDVQLSTYGTIQSVQMQNMAPDKAQAEPVVLPCFSLVCCNKKYCDPDVFTAVNDCGIVYDGGIIVDKDFRTVDPSIYAVGDFSRFSRIHASEPVHCENSSREMGFYVATRILMTHLHYQSNVPEETYAKNPRFKFPRTTSIAIAGSKVYVSSKLAREAHDTNVLISGDLASDRLTALKVDSLGVLVEICYVGKTEAEAKNLSKLLGWHESYLNAAISSYEEGKVEDWIDFLRGDWATALFHDKFAEYALSVRSALSTDKETFTILDKVLDAIDASTDNEKISEVWKEGVGAHGEKLADSTKRIVELNTMEYLRNNKIMLNRFALPPTKKKENK